MATQVLPPARSHFSPYPSSYDPTMFASVPCESSLPCESASLIYQAYGGPHGEGYHGYQPEQQGQHIYMVSPQAPGTEALMRRPPSLSPNVPMRVPPRRDRTPIRHHRPSVSRPRSHSRSELAMAYASEQGQTQPPTLAQPSMAVIPSQSAPTTPQLFGAQSSYAMPSAAESYTDPSSYFPSAGSPPTSLPDFNYQPDAQFQGYYQMGRSASQSVSAGVGMNPQDTTYLPPQGQQPPQGPQGLPSIGGGGPAYPPIQTPLESSPGDLEILSSRPKPQCWDHGCNGRQFSTFSNLLRHQREKSGSAMKSICPYCGTEFTRTTARNGHMYGASVKESLRKSHPKLRVHEVRVAKSDTHECQDRRFHELWLAFWQGVSRINLLNSTTVTLDISLHSIATIDGTPYEENYHQVLSIGKWPPAGEECFPISSLLLSAVTTLSCIHATFGMEARLPDWRDERFRRLMAVEYCLFRSKPLVAALVTLSRFRHGLHGNHYR